MKNLVSAIFRKETDLEKIKELRKCLQYMQDGQNIKIIEGKIAAISCRL